MLNRLSYYIDELRSDGKIDYDVYLNLREMSDQLGDENAALRERLEKALQLPRIERLFNGKVGSYKVVYQDKNNRITSEYYSEEKREAAEARLAELKGEWTNDTF